MNTSPNQRCILQSWAAKTCKKTVQIMRCMEDNLKSHFRTSGKIATQAVAWFRSNLIINSTTA